MSATGQHINTLGRGRPREYDKEFSVAKQSGKTDLESNENICEREDMATTATQNKTISCRAAILWEYGKPLTVETIEVAPPQPREVRVRLVATGLCFSDIHLMEGGIPHAKLPLVPGHEGAGIVESIGPEVTTVTPGDKVFTMFLPHCKQCKHCKGNISNHCTDQWGETNGMPFLRSVGYDGNSRYTLDGKTVYHILGSSAFSEYVVIPEASCVKVNPKTPLEKACIMACGFPTGYGASHNFVRIQPGDRVAVWGLGGVGLSAVVGCKDRTAGTIIGIDVNPSKEEIGRKMGCTHFVDVKTTDDVEAAIRQVTGNEGLDFAFICLANLDAATETAMKCLSIDGTVVLVGIPYPSCKVSVPAIQFFPQRSIRGSVIGGYKVRDDLPKLVDRYLGGELPVDQLITHKFHLDRINDAVAILRNGRCIRTVILF